MAERMLDSVCVVLCEPQDPVNIAAVVRAMKNMGVDRLRLVNPASFDPGRVARVAHDTGDIVSRIQHCESLNDALSDCVRVAGFTARRRAAKRRITDPRSAAAELVSYAEQGMVALMFGREDRGLSNEALDRAHVVVTIPTTDHSSLNLAQAALIALYELHLAVPGMTRTLEPPRKDAPLPDTRQYELAFGDCERALAAMDFFKTRYAEHVMRTVRSLVHRAAPDARELELLRAMAIEVLRTIERVRRSTT